HRQARRDQRRRARRRHRGPRQPRGGEAARGVAERQYGGSGGNAEALRDAPQMTADHGQLIPPGATIGILGGGQLGRMSALAAARLGYKTHIYAPPGDNPAAAVATAATIAAYDDRAALA